MEASSLVEIAYFHRGKNTNLYAVFARPQSEKSRLSVEYYALVSNLDPRAVSQTNYLRHSKCIYPRKHVSKRIYSSGRWCKIENDTLYSRSEIFREWITRECTQVQKFRVLKFSRRKLT